MLAPTQDTRITSVNQRRRVTNSIDRFARGRAQSASVRVCVYVWRVPTTSWRKGFLLDAFSLFFSQGHWPACDYEGDVLLHGFVT